MAEERDGNIKNREMLTYVDWVLNMLYVSEDTNSATFNMDDYTPTLSGQLIRNEDVEIYDTCVEMQRYLGHRNLDPENTYIIPGVKYSDEQGVEHEIEFYIPKRDAELLANDARYFELKLGIHLPDQIYQLRYKGQKIPGTDLDIPEPRLMSESEQDYEDRLDLHYANTDYSIENIPNTDLRKPYLHETVNYHNGDEPEVGYTSEYYQQYLTREARRAINPNQPEQGAPDQGTPQNNRLGEDPVTVTESEDYDRTPLAQRIGSFFHISETSIKSSSNHQKLKVIGLLAGGSVALAGIILTPALHPLAWTAAGLGAAFVGARALIKSSKKHLIPWVKNLFFGKARNRDEDEEEEELTETPNPLQPTPTEPTPTQPRPGQPVPQPGTGTGTGQTGQQAGTGTGEPQPGEPVILDSSIVQGFVSTIELDLQEYENLESQLAVAKANLEELERNDPDSMEIPILHGQIASIINSMKGQLNVISGLTKDFMSGLESDNTLDGGFTHGNN